MAEFNFTNVKATPSKDVPALTRSRTAQPNPLESVYAESMKTTDNSGHGAWLHLDLPGKTEEIDGKTSYGPTVKKAMGYLRQAAATKDKGVSFRVVDGGKGQITLHFQSKPKRGNS